GIADDAAKTGVGAAVGFNGRRVVVRLDLEADVEVVVELDDAGIVLKDADAPVVGPKPLADFLRGAEDSLLQKIVVALAVAVDDALERLVRAVFRPRLRDSLQLCVGRVALEAAEVGLDRLHLVQRKGKLAEMKELDKACVIERKDSHDDALERVVSAEAEIRL